MANMLRDNPTIAVLGAGAVGCYFGGMLARAGKAVTLIARANHVAAINMNGLYLDCLSFKEHVRLNATTDVADISNADLILCCVKSSDTEDAIRLIAPHIKKDAVILSLQNGVDNYERIRATISNPTFPSVVYVATRMAGDGHVEHVGRGERQHGYHPFRDILEASKEVCDDDGRRGEALALWTAQKFKRVRTQEGSTVATGACGGVDK
jgi:2-dehydropantoate 2-reductase